MKKQIAILGAGFTGLTAALRLTQKGYAVSLFEKENQVGGLARGFKQNNWQWSLEESYHHLFASDTFAIKLASELSVPLIYQRPVTATFSHGKIFALDSPLSLLQYPYLSLTEKLRVGAVLAFLKLTPFWQALEKETAKNWLIKTQGEKAWRELWEPLFKGKFGKYFDKITMSWFWARISKRSPSLGYPEGGFQVFADKLAEEIQKNGGKIYLNHELQKATYDNQKWNLSFSKNTKYDLVISTLPTPIFTNIFPQLPKQYVKNLSSISHLYALTLILELKRPFLPPLQPTTYNLQPKHPYWLNINDPSFPFLAVVEHTNFMDSQYYGGSHLLYIGNYLPSNHPYLKKSATELLEIYKPYLQKINPIHDLSSMIHHLYVQPFSQPVVTTNYPQYRPSLTAPLPNLFLGNLDCVYPWDRGTNYAIELGEKLAGLC